MQLCHQHTKATAPKKYWGLLLPDYEAGCKHVIGDFGYLASLNAPNLDLLCDPVEQCEDTGVLTKSGRRYKADAIVSDLLADSKGVLTSSKIFATGYESQWHHLDVRGREGVSLTDKWSQETTSHYQTTAVSGFPNFFMLYGPNSAPPNMSAIYCFENYVDLILELVEPIQKGQFSSVEPDPRAEKAFMAELLGALDKGVWESCKKRTSDPKRNVNMYPWSNMTMFRNTHSRDSKAWVYDVDQGNPS
jgi:cation diffusion facilitator CzcD-associated flavoprotein CzcO